MDESHRFEPVRFTHESRNNKNKKHGIDDGAIAAYSPFYSRVDYPDRVVLASTTPSMYCYTICDSPESTVRMIASCPPCDRQWFYYLEKDRPVYAYADFDLAVEDNHAGFTRPTFLACARDLISRFEHFTAAWYSLVSLDAYNDGGGEWRWFDATTDEKFSLHAHSHLLFPDVATLNTVVQAFREYLLWAEQYDAAALTRCFFSTPKQPSLRRLIMDTNVYNKRPFRTPYSRKHLRTNAYLLPLCLDADQMDDLRWCMPHAVDPDAPVLPTADAVYETRRLCALALLPTSFPRADLIALARDLHALLVSVWRFGDTGGAVACSQLFTAPEHEARATHTFCTADADIRARALWLGVVGELIIVLGLHMHAPLNKCSARERLISETETLFDGAHSLTALAATLDVANDDRLPADAVVRDFSLALAFARAHMPHVSNAVTADEWRSFCTAAPSFLPVPDCAKTLAQMRLAHRDPFGAEK